MITELQITNKLIKSNTRSKYNDIPFLFRNMNMIDFKVHYKRYVVSPNYLPIKRGTKWVAPKNWVSPNMFHRTLQNIKARTRVSSDLFHNG